MATHDHAPFGPAGEMKSLTGLSFPIRFIPDAFYGASSDCGATGSALLSPLTRIKLLSTSVAWTAVLAGACFSCGTSGRLRVQTEVCRYSSTSATSALALLPWALLLWGSCHSTRD